MRILLTAALIAGCTTERSGLQVGEEQIASPDPCTTDELPVAFTEPALDGHSAESLLAALPLDHTADPTWFDGADEPLDLAVAWDGSEVRRVVVSGDDPECDVPDRLSVGVELALVSAAGRLDELHRARTWLRPDEELLLQFQGAPGGSVDLDAVLAEVADLGAPSTSILDVWVSFRSDGDVQGVATAIGWPGTSSEPPGPLDVAEREVALW